MLGPAEGIHVQHGPEGAGQHLGTPVDVGMGWSRFREERSQADGNASWKEADDCTTIYKVVNCWGSTTAQRAAALERPAGNPINLGQVSAQNNENRL